MCNLTDHFYLFSQGDEDLSLKNKTNKNTNILTRGFKHLSLFGHNVQKSLWEESVESSSSIQASDWSVSRWISWNLCLATLWLVNEVMPLLPPWELDLHQLVSSNNDLVSPLSWRRERNLWIHTEEKILYQRQALQLCENLSVILGYWTEI